MNYHVRSFNRRNILPLVFISVALLIIGCASNTPQMQTDAASPIPAGTGAPSKVITGIKTSVGSEGVQVLIDGNSLLSYTSVKQQPPLPLGVVLYFKDTGLNSGIPAMLPENELIYKIDTSELTSNGIMGRVEILLKEDVPHTIVQQGHGLKIAFSKPAGSGSLSAHSIGAKSSSGHEASLSPLDLDAKKIRTVSAATAGKSTIVAVTADGSIRNYKSFTLDRPPRVVFELFGLSSPYKGEQVLAVESPWVKQVRHFSSPDKLRIVIDTTTENLSRFSAWPSETGLIVRVGEDNHSFPAEVAGVKAAEGKLLAGSTPNKSSQVNRIDFSSEDNGKSTVMIGTTEPADYTLKKVGDRLLQLTLKNSRLPEYRERPLITNRFESAVDRIVPARKPGTPENAQFTIELRESVPYFIEQQDRLLLVHFEGSTVPPRTSEKMQIPSLKDTTQKMEIGDVGRAVESRKKDSKKELLAENIDLASTSFKVNEKKYTGEKVALDFYETDIKNVFRVLKEVSGRNFAIDNDVNGKVTLSFEKPVPWDQVLDLILKMNQLGKVEEGDIIRIGTVGTLKKEEEERQAALAAKQKAQEQAIALEPLVTEYISVSYAKAKEEVLPHLQNIITKDRGNVTVDERSNQIIFTDVADKVKQAIALVKKLDAVTPQVIIEARVVEVTSNFANELGILWGAKQGPVQKDALGGIYNWNVAMNFPSAAPHSIGFDFKRIAGTPLELNARLNAVESRGQAKIISAPKVVTLDNKKAKIKQGLEIAYLERDDSGGSSVKFKSVDLLLEVTPHVTPDKRVGMSIFITKNDVQDVVNGVPVLGTNEAQTELLVNDGDTIVIGGILKKTKTTGSDQFPGLGNVPGLGWLFKNNTMKDNTGELLIFITPQIVQLAQR